MTPTVRYARYIVLQSLPSTGAAVTYRDAFGHYPWPLRRHFEGVLHSLVVEGLVGSFDPLKGTYNVEYNLKAPGVAAQRAAVEPPVGPLTERQARSVRGVIEEGSVGLFYLSHRSAAGLIARGLIARLPDQYGNPEYRITERGIRHAKKLHAKLAAEDAAAEARWNSAGLDRSIPYHSLVRPIRPEYQ